MADKINAVAYCEGGLRDLVGKTAHGLIRHSPKYNIVGVVDSSATGQDAGVILDSKPRGIPVFASVEISAREASPRPTVMIVGLAPTGFRGEQKIVKAAEAALRAGLSVHNGLHLFLSNIPDIKNLAARKRLQVVDIRKPPERRLLMFSGGILNVRTPRLLVTGQDAAIGKRTAAIRLCEKLQARGLRPCLIGTGQTAWLQGVRYGVRLDALPMDFSGGEIESAIIKAEKKEKPDIFVIEGQGSLLNPGYSCETMILLSACRPSMLVYVSAPTRSHYVDFPDFELRDAGEEMHLLELISGALIVGVIVHCDSTEQPIPTLPRPQTPVVFGAEGDLSLLVNRIAASL